MPATVPAFTFTTPRFMFPANATPAGLLNEFDERCQRNDDRDWEKLRSWRFSIPEPGEYEAVSGMFGTPQESRDVFRHRGIEGNTALFIYLMTLYMPEGHFWSIPPKDEDLWSNDPARQRHNLFAVDSFFGPDLRGPKRKPLAECGRRHALSMMRAVPWASDVCTVGFRKVSAP